MSKLRTLHKLGYTDAEIDQYAVDFAVTRERAIESLLIAENDSMLNQSSLFSETEDLELKPKGAQGQMF